MTDATNEILAAVRKAMRDGPALDLGLTARIRACLDGKSRSYVEDAQVFAVALVALLKELDEKTENYNTMLETLTAAQDSGSKAVVAGQKARESLRWTIAVIDVWLPASATGFRPDESVKDFTKNMKDARAASLDAATCDGVKPWDKNPELYDCESCSKKVGAFVMCDRCVAARAHARNAWRGTRA